VKTHLWGLESVRLGHRGAGMNSVVALGGNAELQRGDKPDAGVQVVHMRAAGVEAVVDKDYVTATPAITAGGDPLIVRTDVPAVVTGFGSPTDAQAVWAGTPRHHPITNHTTRRATASRDRQAHNARTQTMTTTVTQTGTAARLPSPPRRWRPVRTEQVGIGPFVGIASACSALFGVAWSQLGYRARRGARDLASGNQMMATTYELVDETPARCCSRELLASMPREATI
jgi:hypothetical protein